MRLYNRPTANLVKDAVYLTMGCGEECPYIPGVVRMDWDLPDPAGESMTFMKKVRDEIAEKVSALLDDL